MPSIRMSARIIWLITAAMAVATVKAQGIDDIEHVVPERMLIVLPSDSPHIEDGTLSDKAMTRINRLAKRDTNGVPTHIDSAQIGDSHTIIADVDPKHVDSIKKQFPNAVVSMDGPCWGSSILAQDNPPWGLSRISRRFLSPASEDISDRNGPTYKVNQPYVYEDTLFSDP
jgi:hypothetical protein